MQQQPVNSDVEEARRILTAGAVENAREAYRLASQLASARRYDYARKIVGAARRNGLDDRSLSEKLARREAWYYFKDESLPSRYRVERALSILYDGFDLASTTDQEVIGMLGAIYKRRWEDEGQMRYLHRAIAYYQRGREVGEVEKDQGYNSINIAFLLDVLASREEEEARAAGTTSESARLRRAEARAIRKDIVERLPPLSVREDHKWLNEQSWFHATIAEAYFGLGDYSEALIWLLGMRRLNPPEWESEATVRQLAALARLRETDGGRRAADESSEAFGVIRTFAGQWLGDKDFVGKIGVALSGGGFRASLFHIGVLAKLAELGVLGRVEVLSCVSGGSIIGAHYYLKVRRLLREKSDKDIAELDYVRIVREMVDEFLAGVQRNLRTRVFAGLRTNLKMIFRRDFSAALRLGELFESELFARVEDGEGAGPRWMHELPFRPKGEPEDFAPDRDNWRRAAKVPELIINATSLNTGHNWQFTARGMGESAWSVRTENTEGTVYKFNDYAELSDGRIRLGHAVAASACVPGLFGPVTLRGVFGEDSLVRLVDGGVYDNQGVVGLNDRGCRVLLVSDASGQFKRTKLPGGGMLGGAMRSTEIQGRILRDTLFESLLTQRRSKLIDGHMLLHLRRDLDDLDETCVPSDRPRPHVTPYRVTKAVQAQLSTIRTDLDSFCEVEAYALMASGYRMTEYEFTHGDMRGFKGFSEPHGAAGDWKFLQVADAMVEPEGASPRQRALGTVLKAGRYRFGKTFRLYPRFRYVLYLALAAALALAARAAWLRRGAVVFESLTLGHTLWALAVIIAAAALIWLIARWRDAGQVWLGAFMSLYGFLFAKLHLATLDRLYLRRGSLSRLLDPGGRRDA